MAQSSYYLDQLKKVTPLYPLGSSDPKKKLTIQMIYVRQAEKQAADERRKQQKELGIRT